MGLVLLVGGGSAAAAVIGLPPNGSQVNNDPANGIDPQQDAGVSDVVGGSLVAGGPRVPWGTFEQKSRSSQQIFVRAFKNGQWVTQGTSLNIDPNVVAEAPAIDFAGANRTVPWDSWYEPNTKLGGEKQIFASRFNATANTWVAEGQDRGSGVPSLNIHTNKEAENPSVAGGATVPGNDPVPWVAWQEQDGNVNGSGNHDQIFVSKGVKQATPNNPCAGFKPSSATSVSSFCWQQVGADRLAADGGSSSSGDPSLNVDPSRNGIEPDIAFTGANDKVAWTVWYEVGSSSLGLRGNDQVFAAKIVADSSADGGFHWQTVGRGTTGQTDPLDTSSNPPGFGPCAASTAAEDACSMNANPALQAEDPRVASGTLTAGSRPFRGSCGQRTPARASTRSSSRGLSTVTISSCSTAARRYLRPAAMPPIPTSRSSATSHMSPGSRRTATGTVGLSATSRTARLSSTPPAGSCSRRAFTARR